MTKDRQHMTKAQRAYYGTQQKLDDIAKTLEHMTAMLEHMTKVITLAYDEGRQHMKEGGDVRHMTNVDRHMTDMAYDYKLIEELFGHWHNLAYRINDPNQKSACKTRREEWEATKRDREER